METGPMIEESIPTVSKFNRFFGLLYIIYKYIIYKITEHEVVMYNVRIYLLYLFISYTLYPALQILRSPFFLRILAALRGEWRSSTPHFASTIEQTNENIKYLIILDWKLNP